MSNKRDLLKEAIADAKTVKQTAIKNAKASLEESFTPHLKSMLSAKLQEMDDEDNEEEMEEGTQSESQETEENNVEESESDVNLNEVEDDENEEDDVEDVAGDEEEGDEDQEMSSEEDEELDIEDMSEEDLTSFIEDVIQDMVENGEIEPNGDEEEEGGEEEDVDIEDDEEEEPEEVAEGSDESEYQDEDLDEALKTINSLKSELKEVNLLNAKLLYTNKIFKNKSLSESNKMEVLKSFDKAESTKQAKMIYETLSSSLKVSSTSKRAPKKFKSSASKASGITEGQMRKPIVQNDAFSRMKELAFHNTDN